MVTARNTGCANYVDSFLAVLAAAERMREIFRSQLVPTLACLVPKKEAAARAGLVSTQMLGLAFCRDVLRLPGIGDLGHDMITARLGPTIQRYLFDRLPWDRGRTMQTLLMTPDECCEVREGEAHAWLTAAIEPI